MSETAPIQNNDVDALLRRTKVEVAPETYVVMSVTDEEWKRLLENPELSPRMTAPFLIFKDSREVTLIFDNEDFDTIRHAVRDAAVERGYRLLSFEADLEFDVVGYIAKIATILAASGIPILPFASFSRDHVFVKQEDLATALKSLRGHVEEVC